MTDVVAFPDPEAALEPQRVSQLRPYLRRLRRAETERARLGQLVDAADVELAAARQEFDDAVAAVLDVRGDG